MIIEDNKLTTEKNKYLTNGETYASVVYLGIYDSLSNWHEVPIEEVPQDA